MGGKPPIFYRIMKNNGRAGTKAPHAVFYIDASYTYTRSQKPKILEHTALGWIDRSNKSFIRVVFTYKDEKPHEGLLIPKSAMLVNQQSASSRKSTAIAAGIKKGTPIAVDWVDIVYFNNGLVPGALSRAYTEGLFNACENDVLSIDDPETVIFPSQNTPRNHPEKKPRRYYIPLSLIQTITPYAK